jgi:L-lysine 2,3-aminomutase
MLPDLWKHLGDLLLNGRITSHDLVYDEIVPTDKKAAKDDLATLISKYKGNFKPITKRQAQLALEIVTIFPHLIDPRSKKDQADPWIVAMVVEMMEEANMFEQDSDFVIVSTESEKSSNKIPAVCKYYRVRHMNLFEFFEDNDWQFSLLKKS